MTFFSSIHNTILSLNTNPLFGGLLAIFMNIASKYVVIDVSETQQEYLRNNISRQVMIFVIAFMGTRDIYISLVLTGIFVILADYLFNDQSRFCVISKKIQSGMDTNDDGVISDKEVDKAVELLNKAKMQRSQAISKEAFRNIY